MVVVMAVGSSRIYYCCRTATDLMVVSIDYSTSSWPSSIISGPCILAMGAVKILVGVFVVAAILTCTTTATWADCSRMLHLHCLNHLTVRAYIEHHHLRPKHTTHDKSIVGRFSHPVELGTGISPLIEAATRAHFCARSSTDEIVNTMSIMVLEHMLMSSEVRMCLSGLEYFAQTKSKPLAHAVGFIIDWIFKIFPGTRIVAQHSRTDPMSFALRVYWVVTKYNLPMSF
mmetsp:Transcript_18699/g.31328  ORF Transcript_18699/g.31328 Transcript_18699/m.31328 type:complete len:229 (+) Transcript_18699:374-1060(+)